MASFGVPGAAAPGDPVARIRRQIAPDFARCRPAVDDHQIDNPSRLKSGRAGATRSLGARPLLPLRRDINELPGCFAVSIRLLGSAFAVRHQIDVALWR